LFLDETTAALQGESEAKFYRLLADSLPNSAIVSIGHRPSLIKFHQRFFELRPEGLGAIPPELHRRTREGSIVRSTQLPKGRVYGI
jgi:putative ATP-binding cassette transporter